MSNKPSVAIFCETQCSDGEDEDYVDQLIKKKGENALNELLQNNEQYETLIEKDEGPEIQDSLVLPNTSQRPQITPKAEVAPIVNLGVEQNRTPKSIIGYHNKKVSLENKNNALVAKNLVE